MRSFCSVKCTLALFGWFFDDGEVSPQGFCLVKDGGYQMEGERLEASPRCIITRWGCYRYTSLQWVTEVHADSTHAELVLADENSDQFLGCH